MMQQPVPARPRQSKLRLSLLATALFVMSACGGDANGPATSKPEPGTLVAELVTPAETEGALLVTISGPGLTSATAAQNGQTVHSRAAGDVLNVAVFGTLSNGAVMRIAVPNVLEAASYTAIIREVASTGGDLRNSLTGYALKFRKE